MTGTAAFDQLKAWIHFIGAIDGEIDAIHRIEAEQRNVELGGKNLTLEGGGDTNDVLQLTTGQLRPEGFDHQGSRGTGPETQNHAVLDLLDGGIGHRLLHLGLEIGHRTGLVGRDRSKGFKPDPVRGPASPTG